MRSDSRGGLNPIRVNKGEAQSSSLLTQGRDVALPMLALKFLGTYIFVLDMVLEHVVDGTSNFVGGGYLGIHGATLGAFTPIEGTQGACGMTCGGGCLAKSLTRPIACRQGPRAQYMASRYIVVGSYSAPGSEMLVRRPLAHVGADFGQNGLGQAGTNAHDGSHIHPSQTDKVSPHIRGRLIF